MRTDKMHEYIMQYISKVQKANMMHENATNSPKLKLNTVLSV